MSASSNSSDNEYATTEERLPLKIIRASRNRTREYNSELQMNSIRDLSSSIRKHGLLQHIIVRPVEEGFEIVAGHRRFYACKLLRWKVIPAIVKDLSEKDAFEIQLVENVQRHSLDPIEEARAFKLYVTNYGWGGVTQLANTIMKSEQYVSSRIQLLTLPENIQQKIISGELKVSHTLELLGLGKENQKIIADRISRDHLSVKDIRDLKQQQDDGTFVANNSKKQAERKEQKLLLQESESKNKKEEEEMYLGFPFNNSNYESDASYIRHRQQVFLRQVQLSLKITLSRMDSFIHEYQEQFITSEKEEEEKKEQEKGYNDRKHIKTNDYDHDPISTMLMQFRINIHSMLDENIRQNANLSKAKGYNNNNSQRKTR
jgi:ParB family chromosome partitioning protein